MSIGILTLHIRFPNRKSLKNKRSFIKPIISRLQNEFNLSVAEVGRLDSWKESIIACVVVSNSKSHCEQVLQKVKSFTLRSWPDINIIRDDIELL